MNKRDSRPVMFSELCYIILKACFCQVFKSFRVFWKAIEQADSYSISHSNIPHFVLHVLTTGK